MSLKSDSAALKHLKPENKVKKKNKFHFLHFREEFLLKGGMLVDRAWVIYGLNVKNFIFP